MPYLSLLLPLFFLRLSRPDEDAELLPNPCTMDWAVTVEVKLVKSEEDEPQGVLLSTRMLKLSLFSIYPF